MSKAKRMRLPNGFGQISEIKNSRLRKPFRAMVTVGKSPTTGRPICKLLKPEAYFKTYNEAYMALMEYSQNPYDVSKDVTLKSIFEEWYSTVEQSGVGDERLKDINRTWKYCSAIYNISIRNVKTQQIRDVIEHGTAEMRGKVQNAPPSTKCKIKSLLTQLFDYALSYDLVDKNYAKNYIIPSNITKEAFKVESEHISYTNDEITKLWANMDNTIARLVIIQCYSGWRPNELLSLQISDVDLEKWTFTGGMKTEAGKDRIVPIHTAIRQYVKEWYDRSIAAGSSYLFIGKVSRNLPAVPINYQQYRRGLITLTGKLGLNPEHRLHDARKHFITMAKKFRVDEYALKYMVGHAITDLTEKVYTDRDINWLIEEIEKIKAPV